MHSLDCHVRDVDEKVHLMSDFSKVITAKMNTLTVKRSLYLMLSQNSALVVLYVQSRYPALINTRNNKKRMKDNTIFRTNI